MELVQKKKLPPGTSRPPAVQETPDHVISIGPIIVTLAVKYEMESSSVTDVKPYKEKIMK